MTRARASDGGSAGIRSIALRYASLARPPWPAIHAQRPSRSLSSPARTGSAVASTRPIAVRRLLHGARRLVEPGDASSSREEVDEVTTGARLRVGDLVPQADGPLELVERLGERVACLGPLTGHDSRLERPRQVVRGVPVVGELGRARGVITRSRLEGPRERGMQPGPLARQQVVVHGFLEESVAEDIALDAGRRIGHEHLPGDALSERLVDGGRLEPGGLGEQLRIDPLPRRRRDPQELLAPLPEVGDAGEEDVAQRGRQLGRAVVAGRHEELLGEEGVAAGAGVDRLQQRGIELPPGDRLELSPRLESVERVQLDAFDLAGPLQLGDERQQRVAPVELVRAIRQQDHDGAVAQVADEEAEQVARGSVRPVEVLDDEQQRLPFGDPGQDGQDQLEQPALCRADAQPGLTAAIRRDRTEIRHEARQLGAAVADNGVDLVGIGVPDVAAQRLDHRCVRERAVTEVDAAAGEDDEPVCAGGLGDGRDEARLADAGLAGDERRGCSDPRLYARGRRATARARSNDR